MDTPNLTGKAADAQERRSLELTPYKARSYAFLGLWTKGAWTLKVYGINHRAPPASDPLVDPAILAAARAKVTSHLPEVDREGDHHHTGFVILHHGTDGNWLLLHWWAQEAICCEVLWKSRNQSPTRFEAAGASFMACVWELVVIDFERRAWVDTLLRREGDRDLYLDTRLPDGSY